MFARQFISNTGNQTATAITCKFELMGKIGENPPCQSYGTGILYIYCTMFLFRSTNIFDHSKRSFYHNISSKVLIWERVSFFVKSE